MISTTLPRSERAGLSAIVVGEGRPVVLLHGVGLRAEAWGPQIDALRDNYQVIAPDMPGHGQTPPNPQFRVLDDYVRAVLHLLRTLDEPAVVVGHSMGAMIALELAKAAPDRVGAVAALNGVFERGAKAREAVQGRAAILDGKVLPDTKPTLERWFGAKLSPERAACEACLLSVDPLGYQRAYTAFAHADGPSRSTLEGMACPALFATGAREPNSTPEMSRKMAHHSPKGRALIVEGAAHMMPMTHAEVLNPALLDFVQEVRA